MNASRDEPFGPSDTAGECAVELARRGHADELGPRLPQDDKTTAAMMRIAACNDHVAVLRLLLERGASVNIANAGTRSTTLRIACHMGSVGAVETLLSAKANPNTCGCLTAAARNGQAALVQMLVDAGADVNGNGWAGYRYTPLMAAAGIDAPCGGNVDTVRVLLCAKAQVDGGDDLEGGKTPLHVAADAGCWAVVHLLLLAGADVEPIDWASDTPLGLAVGGGHGKTIQVLLSAGAEVNRGNVVSGATPSGIAAARNLSAILDLLLTAKADVRRADANGQTAVFHAAAHNCPEVLARLLPACVNRADVRGTTPLLIAAKYGADVPVIELLINAKADPQVADHNGLTAARQPRVNPSTFRLLLRAKATADRNGMTAARQPMCPLSQQGNRTLASAP